VKRADSLRFQQNDPVQILGLQIRNSWFFAGAAARQEMAHDSPAGR
jgi:hypothetical protein